jgi:hypothetical protein
MTPPLPPATGVTMGSSTSVVAGLAVVAGRTDAPV